MGEGADNQREGISSGVQSNQGQVGGDPPSKGFQRDLSHQGYRDKQGNMNYLDHP